MPSHDEVLWQPGRVADSEHDPDGREPNSGDERGRRGRSTRRPVASFAGEYRPGAFTASLRQFTRRYGWRAYALPLLAAITVAALLTTGGTDTAPQGARSQGPASHAPSAQPPSAQPSAPPTAPSSIQLKSDQPGAGARQAALRATALPAGPSYTKRGKATFRVLEGTSKVVGKGKLYRYSIDVENGLSGINLHRFAGEVQSVLADPRSWAGHGVSMKRVDSGRIDFHITLVSSLTVRDMCGYQIKVETSCYLPAGANSMATVNRVIINNSRWVRGAAAYIGDLAAYHVYLINHEVGHALGHGHAHACLPGGLAPTMMEQTIGLKSAKTGKLCQANPWPYPPGVKGAPGKEGPDTPQNSEFGLNDE